MDASSRLLNGMKLQVKYGKVFALALECRGGEVIQIAMCSFQDKYELSKKFQCVEIHVNWRFFSIVKYVANGQMRNKKFTCRLSSSHGVPRIQGNFPPLEEEDPGGGYIASANGQPEQWVYLLPP